MDAVVGMVLAAGLGTRLRPLTDLLPKPAVPVAGLPLVRYALARLRAAGARRAVVNVHHLPEAMERAAAEAARALGMELAVSREPVIAGTGGALREARRWLEGAEAIAVWNGDVLFDVDLGAAVAAHRQGGALATMLLAPMPPGASYATVDVDGGLRVRRIAGHGPGGESLRPLHFTGVHVLSPALLDQVPVAPFACDVNRHVYPPLLAAGGVHGLIVKGYWNDLGTPGRYLQANLDVLSGAAGLTAPGAEPLAGLGVPAPGVRVAAGARVQGAVLVGPALVLDGATVAPGARIGPGAILGAGAVVGPGAVVERAVVWPGTAVAAGERVADAVAAGTLRVPAAG
ncbi:MAG TPA: NDP-sugar synthase [Anaeromyxobacteraceae bacterium]|nr:NDP-sugar synthase [Anaeromyxobacteraceae bacterium]